MKTPEIDANEVNMENSFFKLFKDGEDFIYFDHPEHPTYIIENYKYKDKEVKIYVKDMDPFMTLDIIDLLAFLKFLYISGYTLREKGKKEIKI